jgi:glutamate/tyrosine decarboxylase-like PLP-dependent enzyme
MWTKLTLRMLGLLRGSRVRSIASASLRARRRERPNDTPLEPRRAGRVRIPERGLSREALFERLASYRAGEIPWREGRAWAYVYDPGPEAEAVIQEAFTSHLSENGLDPTAFPSALRLENEVVAVAREHLAGDAGVVGNCAPPSRRRGSTRCRRS